MTVDPQGHVTLHLDLRGLKCPLPVLRTRKALSQARPGTVMIVACTDPLSGIDIPHLLHETGHILEAATIETDALNSNIHIFTIRVV